MSAVALMTSAATPLVSPVFQNVNGVRGRPSTVHTQGGPDATLGPRKPGWSRSGKASVGGSVKSQHVV